MVSVIRGGCIGGGGVVTGDEMSNEGEDGMEGEKEVKEGRTGNCLPVLCVNMWVCMYVYVYIYSIHVYHSFIF